MSPFRPNGHLPNVQKTKETDIMIATLAVKGANAINLSMTWHNNDDFSNVEMDFFVWPWPRLWSTNCYTLRSGGPRREALLFFTLITDWRRR